ncbi:hypothetical protein FACS1894151_00640 [Spirochaetia bacterium]|nr:hypothetical protein FACS1894151_00640 [Spirochaetia bacterium]
MKKNIVSPQPGLSVYKLSLLFFGAICAFFLASCFSLINGPSGKDGNLVISIGGSDARSVLGEGTKGQLSYDITATNGEQEKKLTLSAGKASGTMYLSPGLWHIAAEAYLPEGRVHVGTGSGQDISIAAGRAAHAQITMDFDNVTPASVIVGYNGKDYKAVLREDGKYRAVIADNPLSNGTPIHITINKALDDQDIVPSFSDGQPDTSYGLTGIGTSTTEANSPKFTIKAGDHSQSYTLAIVIGIDPSTLPLRNGPEEDLRTYFTGGGTGVGGKLGVSETFNVLSTIISDPSANLTDIIQLGDYIELESLTVEEEEYPPGGGSGGPINIQPGLTGQKSLLLRLIVVGINSFNGKNGNNTPHVVFQFQHIPGSRSMAAADNNTGGYNGSDMRKYLVPTPGNSESGRFLASLISAGVPEDVLWAPSRRVAFSSAPLEDKLWLPTEYEIFGANTCSREDYENSSNQVQLQYYTDASNRIKEGDDVGTPAEYWLASPGNSDTNSFCLVAADGGNTVSSASNSYGVAPAFCVK